jgi:hypothetical protein
MTMLAVSVIMGVSACWAGIAPVDRGARIVTDRYQVEIRDGVVVSILNKLTGEEYLDPYVNLNNIVRHLPGGLGSQATDTEREAAATLYKWPWWEHPAASIWPNHHSPSAASKCEFKAKDDSHATVVYTGLTDGTKPYPDETLSLELAIDTDTGDLLITPIANSPRKGVYSSSLTVSALGPAITAEAPIFDGVRLDRNMQPMLWVNQWGGYWDYAFLAFNGYKKGAVAVWCQDPELKYYKYLDYLINQEGISFSFTGMNLPPFDDLKEAGTVTWRIQAFDKGWSQAVARFRDWRLKNVKIASRPDWAKQISFVNGGVNASKSWVDLLETYLGPSNLDRTITFGATIRGEGFDQNHANNTPYKGFKEDMKYWKQKGPKMMAYLQPMIMWSPSPKGDRETAAVEAHKKADTVSVFQKPREAKSQPYIDQHHLGQPDWQRWFLDWVKEYIQDYGSDAVYHDQSYHCPVDARGLAIGGMTSPQGMADYFYKAQTENPNSIHGTEHMTEVNNVGASLGIGSGILWGTAESMRRQRIDHPSPICNALHYPNGAIFSFPHYSQITSRNLQRIHWGMNISEGRGELAYAAIQGADAAASQGLVNERWMDVLRSHTFVHKGLHAVFPEDWDRSVLSYFKGAKGEDVRYVKTAWGSAFIEITGNATNLLYGRIHGTPYARAEGGVYGWPLYNAKGPAGLNPSRYYVLDPNLKRPAAYFSSNNQFSPSLYEGYVDEGFTTDAFAYLKIKPREDILNIITYDSVVLNAPAEPKAVYVNGAVVKPHLVTNGQWKIDFQLTGPVAIVALLKDGPEGFDKIAAGTVGRTMADDWMIDQAVATFGTNAVKATTNGFSCDRSLVLAPIRAPADQGDGTLKVSFSSASAGGKVEFNGVEKPVAPIPGTNRTVVAEIALPLKAGEQGLLAFRPGGRVSVSCQWTPKAIPAAATNAPAAK